VHTVDCVNLTRYTRQPSQQRRSSRTLLLPCSVQAHPLHAPGSAKGLQQQQQQGAAGQARTKQARPFTSSYPGMVYPLTVACLLLYPLTQAWLLAGDTLTRASREWGSSHACEQHRRALAGLISAHLSVDATLTCTDWCKSVSENMHVTLCRQRVAAVIAAAGFSRQKVGPEARKKTQDNHKTSVGSCCRYMGQGDGKPRVAANPGLYIGGYAQRGHRATAQF